MNKSICFILSLFILFSCKKDTDSGYPLVYTGEVLEVSDDGATFTLKIAAQGNDNIIEFGFIWDTDPEFVPGHYEKHVIHENPETGVFSQEITTTLEKGVVYYVRAYARTADFISLGKVVSFLSLGSQAPQILDFNPKNGNLSDTIMILGKSFSIKTVGNHVMMGDFQASVIKACQDTLIIIVPGNLYSSVSQVSVDVAGRKAIASEKFNLVEPNINDFNPKTGSFGTQVTIYGKNFLSNITSLRVFFGSYNAEIIESTDQSLIVKVPDSLNVRQCGIKVRMNNLNTNTVEDFKLESFKILDYFPKVALTGNIITLTGTYFSPVASNNIVKIGGLKANIINCLTNKLEVRIPLQDQAYFPDRNVKIGVEVLGEKHEYNEQLLINDKWFRLYDFPGTDVGFSNYFVVGNQVFIELNRNNQLWRFTPETNEWVRMQNFAGQTRAAAAGFYLEGNIYFGTGQSLNDYTSLNDFWKYDIATNTWTRLNDFTGNPRHSASGFAIQDKGYFTSGVEFKWNSYNSPTGDCWEYASVGDSWLKINGYDNIEWGDTDGLAGGVSVVTGNNAYYGLGGNNSMGDCYMRVYAFSPALNNNWERITNFPEDNNNSSMAFALDGIPYFRKSNTDFYRYISSTSTWEKVETKILTDVAISFSVGNKAYMGMGKSKAMWEYDPSR